MALDPSLPLPRVGQASQRRGPGAHAQPPGEQPELLCGDWTAGSDSHVTPGPRHQGATGSQTQEMREVWTVLESAGHHDKVPGAG